MIQFRYFISACAAFVAATAASAPARAVEIELRGAGSTFVAPLMEAWINGFDNTRPKIAVHFAGVGSGEGVERFLAGSVDFGASDNVLSSAEAAKVGRGVIQTPSTAGMIVLAYNLPNVKGPLKLPKDVYADIFLGKIKDWDDPRIRAANPDLKLPSRSISLICRLDSSGTTYAFTDHLAAVSKSWANGPGVGKVINWPSAPMLARSNEGVAARIRISEGSIGYVEYGFALRLNLPMATLENKEGQFVAPTPQSGVAALASTADVALEALDASTTNPGGAKSYPIVTYSWLMLYRDYPPEKAQAVKAFVNYSLEEGQSYAPYFGYLPLPAKVVEKGKATLSRINTTAAATVAPSDKGP
jgi:phosphate transport system substrate-binding protein